VILVGLFAMTASACSGSDDATATSVATTTSVVELTTTTAPAAASTTTVPASTSTVAAPTKTLLELATEEGRLGTLLGLLDTAGLTATLEGAGPFTLIAPIDDAFKKMDPATLDAISKSPEVLAQVLNYHLIGGPVLQADLDAGFVQSTEGSPIALQATDKFPTFNGQTVIRAGRATNGTIVLIDSVLLPIDLKLP
jgi:uncharacterized surface protein with fasciclin (FAS1) repeats